MAVCKICGNESGNREHVAREMMWGFRDPFTYLECSACGCVQLVNVPVDMSKYYPHGYYSFAEAGPLKNILVLRRAAYALGRRTAIGWLASQVLGADQAMESVRWANVPVDASVLDVGCGSGELILHMSLLGFKSVLGVDPYIKHDIHHGTRVTILKKELADIQDKFDVVMLHHSFEHMQDPQKTLQNVAALLKPNGRVLLRVPVADSYAWRHYGINWMHLDPPRHLFLHTQKSIGVLAAKTGLQIEKTVRDGNASQFLGSEQYVNDIPLAHPKSAFSGGIHRWTNWRKREG